MNIPFLEISGVGIAFQDNQIQWIELSRLGKTVKIQGFGEIAIQGAGYRSEANLLEALDHLPDSWKDKALYIGCSLPGAYQQTMTVDAPFFEDQDEFDDWLEKEKESLGLQSGNETVITHQILDIHEDLKRCHFAWIDKHEVDYLTGVLAQKGLPIQYTSPSSFAPGYSLIFDEDFLDGASALLEIEQNGAQLSCFKNGVIRNHFFLHGGEDVPAQYYLDVALSNLKTEEGSYEDPELFSDIFVADKRVFPNLELLNNERRRLVEYNPLSGIQRSQPLPHQYLTAAGLAVKSVYQGLDILTFSAQEDVDVSEASYGKKELVRTAGLLFAPLVLMVLLIYAGESFINTNLSESTQVLNLIQDKVDKIEEEQDNVQQLFSEFESIKSLVNKRSQLARHFELLARTVPSNVWLTELAIMDEETGRVQVLGYGKDAREMNRFIDALNAREDIENVQMDLSERTRVFDVLPEAEFNRATNGEIIEFQLTITIS